MTRKVIGVAVAAALLVALAAGVALADRVAKAVVNCKTIPCYSTRQSDIVEERRGTGVSDDIILRRGDDLVYANRYGRDTDRVQGGPGDDKIYVNDGDTLDRVSTGTQEGGGSWCIVDSRVEAGRGCTKVTFR